MIEMRNAQTRYCRAQDEAFTISVKAPAMGQDGAAQEIQ
jgi:hypothetical protein